MAPGFDLDEVDRVLGLAELARHRRLGDQDAAEDVELRVELPGDFEAGSAAGLAEQAKAIADFEAVIGGEGVGEDRLVVAQAAQHRRATLLPFDVDRLFDVAAGRRDPGPAPPGSSFACSARIVATALTPGTLRAATAAPPGIGEKPSLFWITRPPAKFSSTTWATELFSPAAKTVTKVTTIRPIISAAAVTAVRLGLRWAFSRERRPSSRRSRSSGQPAIRRQGRHQVRAEERDGEDDDDGAAADQARRGAGAGAAEEADQDHRQAGRAEQQGDGDAEQASRRRLGRRR